MITYQERLLAEVRATVALANLEPWVCALCDKEISKEETPVHHIGQDFHRECSLIYRIRRLETQVQGLLAREVV